MSQRADVADARSSGISRRSPSRARLGRDARDLARAGRRQDRRAGQPPNTDGIRLAAHGFWISRQIHVEASATSSALYIKFAGELG